MLEENKTPTQEELDKDSSLPVEINKVPLEKETQEIVNKIVAEDDIDNLKNLVKLFNVAQTKKNALRSIKLQNLLGTIEDQAIERFEKHPDQISDKLLLDYMETIQNNIDKANAQLTQLEDPSLIRINNNKNEVNINIGKDDLTSEEKEHVLNAINMILASTKDNNQQAEVVEAEVINSTESNNN